VQWILEIASTSVWFDEKMDGASNFLQWKVRVKLLLEENNIWVIVKDVVTLLTNPQQLIVHNMREVKSM
jgi:hypothetical protein